MFYVKKTEFAGGSVVVTLEDTSGDFPASDKYIVAKEFFKPLGIAEGDAADEEKADAVKEAAALTEAVSKALDVLSYSGLSRRALVDKLRLKYKIDRGAAEAAADYVVRRGYLDEDAQASRIAESAVRSKLWGRRRVVAGLYAKGYPKECAERAANSVGERAYAAALSKLTDKKAKSLPKTPEEVRKLVSALIRMGHDPSAVKEAVVKKSEE